jgi:two-component system phosphate regulon sensor histidine kinase PhoR
MHSALLIILAVVVVTFLVALRLFRSSRQAVKDLSEIVSEWADGRFKTRLPIDKHGRLGRELNLAADQIQSKIQELLHDKAQLTTILSNMSEAVVATDIQGRVVVVNPALTKLLGVKEKDAVGKIFLEAMRHSQLNQLLQAVLQSRASRTDEVRTFSPDEHTFEAQAVALMDGRRCMGALLVLHDITQIRRLEQVRRDFVANVSHELRTPLASIKGFAETLLGGAIDDKSHRDEFLGSIEKQVDRRLPVHGSVDLRELFNDVTDSLKSFAKKRGVALAIDIPSTFPALQADRGQIRQVLVNLLDNAIKFNKENGTVKISAMARQDGTGIVVEDTGSGIPAQDLPRIFERFYRVDKGRSRDMGGTGLGLSIVKHIVEAHGGSVSVESSIGKGSSFTVILPLK